jgi:hypothetical protein
VCIWFVFPTFFKNVCKFFLHFLHKTYNADNTWIDKRMRQTVEEENEQTANEKKTDYNQHTHTHSHTHRERERKKERKEIDKEEKKKLTSTNK